MNVYRCEDWTSVSSIEAADRHMEAVGVVQALCASEQLRRRIRLTPVVGSCIARSAAVNDELRLFGHSPELIEGYIRVGNTWQQHRVSLLRFSRTWLVIDTAAAQLPDFEDTVVLVLLCDPSFEALSEMLVATYKWWAPSADS